MELEDLFGEKYKIKKLEISTAGILYNAGKAKPGEIEYQGTTRHNQPSNRLLYLSASQSVAEAYASASAVIADSETRIRTFKLERPIKVIWVSAHDVFMGPLEEKFLVNSKTIEGIAQHNNQGDLIELTLRYPYPIVQLNDVAKVWVGFVDLCI